MAFWAVAASKAIRAVAPGGTPGRNGGKERIVKKRLAPIVFILGALIALSVLLYPIVAGYVNSKNQSRAVMDYLDDMAVVDGSGKLVMLEAARAHNLWLLGKSNRFSFTDGETAQYKRLLDAGRGIMGVLEIDKIGVRLPIYHGTDEAVLQVGIGHMQNSSLPVGGAGTHVFITGHRGLPSSKLLSNLDKIAEGDVFILYVLSDTLTYQVDEIKIVLPDEAETMTIDRDMDYCTLVTCTPYGVNTHRLLVRGQRIETAPVETIIPNARRLDKLTVLPFFLVPVLLVLFIVAAVKCVQISKRKKAE